MGKGKISHKDYLTHRSCWAADCCRLEGEAGESSLHAWPALGLFSWPLLLAVDRVWPPDLLFDYWQLFLNQHTETGSAVIPVTGTSVKVLSRNTLIMNLQCSQSKHSTCAQQICTLRVTSMKLLKQIYGQLQDYNLFTEDFEDLKFSVNIGHNRLLASTTPSSL